VVSNGAPKTRRSSLRAAPHERAGVKPRVAIAGADSTIAEALAARASVSVFPSAIALIAHVVADAPDVVVLSQDDPTWVGVAALGVLTTAPTTSWIAWVVLGDESEVSFPNVVWLSPDDASQLPAVVFDLLALT
jgi:hypothetical protein